MKKNMMLITGICLLVLSAHISAFAQEALEQGSSPEIRGDREYVGEFAGFRGNEIQIELERTGYRVSLPLADDVEYLRKDYSSYDPKDLFQGAPVMAIEVGGEIVQVIMLWKLPH